MCIRDRADARRSPGRDRLESHGNGLPPALRTGGVYRYGMAPGTGVRSCATTLLRCVALLVPFLLSVGLIPSAVRAADPRNMDVLPAPAVGRLGGPPGPVAPIPSGSNGSTESARVVFHGPRTDRVVALTFDDGYAPANVRQSFEELTRRGWRRPSSSTAPI